MFEGKQIDDLLHALGEYLEELESPHFEFVVIGGAALNCLGFIIRPTKDIDLMAIVERDSASELKLRMIKELPKEIQAAAEFVATQFNLQEGWLNTEPSVLVEDGLPQGIEKRMEYKDFGSRLRIYFISRYDQIHLKL